MRPAATTGEGEGCAYFSKYKPSQSTANKNRCPDFPAGLCPMDSSGLGSLATGLFFHFLMCSKRLGTECSATDVWGRFGLRGDICLATQRPFDFKI